MSKRKLTYEYIMLKYDSTSDYGYALRYTLNIETIDRSVLSSKTVANILIPTEEIQHKFSTKQEIVLIKIAKNRYAVLNTINNKIRIVDADEIRNNQKHFFNCSVSLDNKIYIWYMLKYIGNIDIIKNLLTLQKYQEKCLMLGYNFKLRLEPEFDGNITLTDIYNEITPEPYELKLPEFVTKIISTSHCNIGTLIINAKNMLIATYSLSSCTNLKNLVFNSERIEIGAHALNYNNLEKLIFNSSKEVHIGEKAFNNCTSLTELNVKGLAHLGNYTFVVCPFLEKINISGYIDLIHDESFKECYNLKEANVYNTRIDRIYLGIFCGNHKRLRKLKLPKYLKQLIIGGDIRYLEELILPNNYEKLDFAGDTLMVYTDKESIKRIQDNGKIIYENKTKITKLDFKDLLKIGKQVLTKEDIHRVMSIKYV